MRRPPLCRPHTYVIALLALSFVSSACRSYQALGQPCGPDVPRYSPGPCAPGLTCVGEHVPPPPAGATVIGALPQGVCARDGGDLLGEPCNDVMHCAPDLRCSPASVCVIGQREGESCSDALQCANELACDARSQCTPAARCMADIDCPAGFGCVGTSGDARCAVRCAPGTGTGCAAGYRCLPNGAACERRLGHACYVTDQEPESCGRSGACSAESRTCVLLTACTASGTCGGYACLEPPAASCAVNCHGDADCAAGHRCDVATFRCVPSSGAECDPGSDNSAQCGVGMTCAAGSSTCVPAAPCMDDSTCGGFGCWNGECLQACTANVVFCAVGRACNAATHRCE
jgi:hypothetical protein